VRLGLLTILVVALAACGSPEPDRDPGPETLEGAAPDLLDPVEVDADGFRPAELELDTDQGFELVNVGSDPLRVVGELDGEQEYDTGLLAPDESTVVAFTTEGSYEFSVPGAPDADVLAVRVVLSAADAEA
jgi:hypothetical protein